MPEVREVESLLAAVADGDRAAFARLYDSTSAAVFGILLGMLRSSQTAEEVAQEVYLEVWRKASTFDPGRGSGMTWISLIARSRAVDRIRAERAYEGAVDRAGDAPSVAQLLGENRDDPEEAASLGERRRLVRAALSEMPAEQREAVLLAFFGGYTHSEIAEREGMPLGTVKSRIRAGLARVEAHLRPVLGREG